MKPDYKLVSQISLATGLAVLGSTGVARADELATLRANQAALSAQQIALDREQELLKARMNSWPKDQTRAVTRVRRVLRPRRHQPAAAALHGHC
jgi:hypothetical protein